MKKTEAKRIEKAGLEEARENAYYWMIKLYGLLDPKPNYLDFFNDTIFGVFHPEETDNADV